MHIKSIIVLINKGTLKALVIDSNFSGAYSELSRLFLEVTQILDRKTLSPLVLTNLGYKANVQDCASTSIHVTEFPFRTFQAQLTYSVVCVDPCFQDRFRLRLILITVVPSSIAA